MPQSNLQKIQQFWDDVGILSGVRYELLEGDPNFITSIIFEFDDKEIKFKAEPDYDEMIVELNRSEVDSDCKIVDVSQFNPWATAIGSRPSWIWILTNNQGYEDGARIDFGNENDDTTLTVDLIVMASSINLYISREINRGLTKKSSRSPKNGVG